jgi:hypothetical protein
VAINQTGISWQGDIGHRYARTPTSADTQWINPENEHFMVWMRTSGLPNFVKPWGRIEQTLPRGTYTVSINTHYNNTQWMGTRSVVLTTASSVGGKNFLLPTSFLLIAILSCLATVFFCWRFWALRDLGKISN